MKHVFPTYKRFPIDLVNGTGTVVTDKNGKTYLDFTSGWRLDETCFSNI
ncbi:hypothetical protein C9835_12200 [Listeria monocytogenes]|nr:hypothetical protein C9835_12200 [Listeria monocytogenes]